MEEWKGVNEYYFVELFQKEHGFDFAEMGISDDLVDVEKFFPGIKIDPQMQEKLDAIESRRARNDCCGESQRRCLN